MAEGPSREYKIIIIGDPNVGKTSYFLRVRDGNFVETEELRSTILSGVEYLKYGMKIDDCNVVVRPQSNFLLLKSIRFLSMYLGPPARHWWRREV